ESRTNAARRSSTTQSTAPERRAFSSRPCSSPAPCPTSAAKHKTLAPYRSRNQGTIAEVSSPPEYASTTSGPIDSPPVGLCMVMHKNTGAAGPVKASGGERGGLFQPLLHGAAGALGVSHRAARVAPR